MLVSISFGSSCVALTLSVIQPISSRQILPFKRFYTRVQPFLFHGQRLYLQRCLWPVKHLNRSRKGGRIIGYANIPEYDVSFALTMPSSWPGV
jgi:hypothetical protein